MKKEQIQNLAKDYCKNKGIEPTIYNIHSRANFLQSMIDQRHIVEASKLTWNEEAVKNIHNAYELLESKGVFGVGKEDLKFAFTAGRLFESACSCKDCPKPVDFNEWYKNFKPCTTVAEPTVSSAGKEVKTAILAQNYDELTEALSYNESLGYVSGAGGSINPTLERKYPVIVPVEQSYWLKDDLVKCIRLYNVIPISRIQFKSSPASTVMPEISDEEIDERAKEFKIWCDHQEIAGRTTHKLFLDWKQDREQLKSRSCQ